MDPDERPSDSPGGAADNRRLPLGLGDWSPRGSVASVFDMTTPDAWKLLARRYTYDKGDPPLTRIFDIAQEHGVVSVVAELRYIDADWRSQLARFFNGTFRRYPSVCHRLHFFTKTISDDLAALDDDDIQEHYRGYTVLRPYPISPVGRTMIAPPPELDAAVRCDSTEQIDLFGHPLTITAMPFISQDTQFMRCAHAAIWMVLTHARHFHGLRRVLPGDIYDAGRNAQANGRQLPNDGLSPTQLIASLDRLGLSPSKKALPITKDAEAGAGPLRLYTIMRRYVNSSLPPVVISDRHAWVVVAYDSSPSGGDEALTLWRHDDTMGPYIKVDDPWEEASDKHRPWRTAYLPLLPKAWMDAERAAAYSRDWIHSFLTTEFAQGTTLQLAHDREEETDRATFRTYLTTSTRFKQALAARNVPTPLVKAYRFAPMSRLIWVVEIVDRGRRRTGQPDVIGEIILDATLTQHEPVSDPHAALAIHVDSIAFIPGVDQSELREVTVEPGLYYSSGCPTFPGNRGR